MSYDEIIEYIQSGKLDNEEVGLGDTYDHLRNLPPTVVDEVADLPTVPVGEPLHYKASDTTDIFGPDEEAETLVDGPTQTLDELDPIVINPVAESILKAAAIENVMAGFGFNVKLGVSPVKTEVLDDPDAELLDDEVRKKIVKEEAATSTLTEGLVNAIEEIQPVKGKRGRKTQYDVSGLAIGESIVYHKSLASGRVLASLKGRASMEAGDSPSKYFQATEKKGVVKITRLS